jgi:hypothetical protein
LAWFADVNKYITSHIACVVQMSRENLSMQGYVTGAIVANSAVFLGASLLSFTGQYLDWLGYFIFTFVLIFVGAVAAGYIMTLRLSKRHVVVGAIVGLSGYLLHIVLLTLMNIFFGAASLGGDLWLILGFVSGGSVGGFLVRALTGK